MMPEDAEKTDKKAGKEKIDREKKLVS